MIARLRGAVVERGDDSVVLDVHGVGYRVACTGPTARALPLEGDVVMHTVTYVREDTLALYGFATPDERWVFERLLGASGVGPKLALAILSEHPPDVLRRIVAQGDGLALRQVSGVGAKGAERLLVELRGRLDEERRGIVAAATGAGVTGDATRPGTTGVDADLAAALATLGYGTREVAAAMAALPAERAQMSVSILLRHALRQLAPARGVSAQAGGREER